MAAQKSLPVERVQLVPAHVAHEGPAAVGKYFEPRVTHEAGGALGGALRGRRLAGRDADLPQGFSGVVLQNLGPPGGEAKWRRRAAFDALRVWRLETAPDPEGDGTWRTFSAMQVAQRVAQCDPDRVSATVEGMRAKPGDA